MNKLSLVAALAGLLSVGTGNLASAQEQSTAATLSKTEGKVMVDRGTGYVSAQANTALKQGDRVITLGGSGAEIVFKDGCKANLKENNLMEISREGCKAAIASVGKGAGGAVVSSDSSTPKILGAIAAGGAIVAATHNSGGSNTPISTQ